MRSLKIIAIFSFGLCLLGSLTVTPAFAQFSHVAKGQTVKAKVGLRFTTNSGLYPVGCYGQKAGKLTISGADAADFKVTDDGISGQTCGRDSVLYAEITFTPSKVGFEQAKLSATVVADHAQFNGYFQPTSTTLEGIGVAPPITWSFFRIATRLMATTEAAVAAPIMFWPSETERDEDYHDLNHYTGENGHVGISQAGYIRIGQDGFVYLTPDKYTSGKQVQQKLALSNTPTGLFAIPEANIGGVYYPTIVGPKYGQPGGGLEIRVPYNVSVQGATWFPISP